MGVKRWYAALAMLWLAGAFWLIWQFANGPHHRVGSWGEAWSNSWGVTALVFDPRSSLTLLRGKFEDVALALLIWLPVLAAPFGLLTRIDLE